MPLLHLNNILTNFVTQTKVQHLITISSILFVLFLIQLSAQPIIINIIKLTGTGPDA